MPVTRGDAKALPRAMAALLDLGKDCLAHSRQGHEGPKIWRGPSGHHLQLSRPLLPCQIWTRAFVAPSAAARLNLLPSLGETSVTLADHPPPDQLLATPLLAGPSPPPSPAPHPQLAEPSNVARPPPRGSPQLATVRRRRSSVALQ
ncbi:hypothetical protein NL676_039120 [Syzygium grande]|nr:hypothetical protein NL676_039120 [Syzygium grande]